MLTVSPTAVPPQRERESARARARESESERDRETERDRQRDRERVGGGKRDREIETSSLHDTWHYLTPQLPATHGTNPLPQHPGR